MDRILPSSAISSDSPVPENVELEDVKIQEEEKNPSNLQQPKSEPQNVYSVSSSSPPMPTPSTGISTPYEFSSSRPDFFQHSARLGALKDYMMDEASETASEELEMLDYDNPEDHIHERKIEDENAQFNRIKLTAFRVLITVLVGMVLGVVGFCVSKAVSGLIHANVSVLTSLMNADRPAAAFFAVLCISLSFTLLASILVTFGSWQTRGSGVGRLNAYLSGIYSAQFLNLKTLIVKITGLVLTVGGGIKQGMEGPFIHIGAMIGLHVSRFSIGCLRLLGSRGGLQKYVSIISGVVDERMFITGGAAAGFSVAFNAPIAGVLYVQDGAFAYWNGEYTFRTFLCTMTAVTTLNFCFISSDILPTRGLIDTETQPSTNITIQEFWGFLLLGILGGIFGAAFTKLNVTIEHLRSKYLGKRRLPNVLDVFTCTFATVLVSFVLPFMFSCHSLWDSCTTHDDRCLRFSCGPHGYSDLATFFFELPESTIRILYDRTLDSEIPVSVLIVFCIAYFLMSCLSYGMAVPGGLFIPSIIIGAAYGRVVGQLVASVLPVSLSAAGVITKINPGVYAILGSASMLGGMTRMTLPISVMMIEVTSDAQFLIPIMFVVLISKVIADRLVGALYSEHLKMDGLLMVFGDKMPNQLNCYTAKQLMGKNALKSLNVVETLENAQKALTETQHNSFPVIDSMDSTLKTVSIIEKISQYDGMKNSIVRGSFLGLIQRRHLSYVLTAMPAYQSIHAARESEPMTAEPTNEEIEEELQLRRLRIEESERVRKQLRRRFSGIGGNKEETYAETPVAGRLRPGTISASLNALASDNSQAKPAILSQDGVNNTASFIDWCATQDPFKKESKSDGPEAAAAPSVPAGSTWVNLSPFIDQGAYMVSENTTARRVWGLFRSLGMRHIVVINQRNQPVGIITRRDVIRMAIAE